MPEPNRIEQITKYYNSLKSSRAKLNYLMDLRFKTMLKENLEQDVEKDMDLVDRLTQEFFMPKKADGTYDFAATDERMGLLVEHMYTETVSAGRRYNELINSNEPLITMQPDEASKERMARYLTNITSRGNLKSGMLNFIMITAEEGFTKEYEKYFADKYKDALASDEAAYLGLNNKDYKSEPTFFNIYSLKNTQKINRSKNGGSAVYGEYETGALCGSNESHLFGQQFDGYRAEIEDFTRQRAEYFLSEPEPFASEIEDREKAIVEYAKSIEKDERALIKFWMETETAVGAQDNSAEPTSIITSEESSALSDYMTSEFLAPKLPNGQPDTDTFVRRFTLIGRMRGENNIEAGKKVRELEESDKLPDASDELKAKLAENEAHLDSAIDKYKEDVADHYAKNPRKANRDKVEAIRNTMVTLDRASGQLASHTAFKFMNSKEYNNFIESFNIFNDKYFNLLNGGNQYGRPLVDPENGPRVEDMEALIEDAEKMKKAAKDYIDAKAAQKGGGIDKHKTKQGEDRLSFANLIADFDLDALTTDKYLNRKQHHENKKMRFAELNEAEAMSQGRDALDNKKADLSAKAKQWRAKQRQKNGQAAERNMEAPQKPAMSPENGKNILTIKKNL